MKWDGGEVPTPREGDRDFRYDRDDLPDNPPEEGWWGVED